MDAMQISFICPECQGTVQAEFDRGTAMLSCTHCQHVCQVPAGAVTDEGVTRCLVCPSRELFVRKDFPQNLGVGIVVVGLIAYAIAVYQYQILLSFVILFATALADVALYLFVGDLLQCYRCQAQYRGLKGVPQHAPFDLETHEKYRQQQARLKQSLAATRHDKPSTP